MKRHISSVLVERLSRVPCVVLLGPRQSGRKTQLREILPEWKIVDLEKLADHHTVARDPDLFLHLNAGEVVFHEAALLPTLLPALQAALDRDPGRMGRFVITGSSSFELTEGLAGRTAIVEMGPLTLAEACGLPLAPLYRLIGECAPSGDLLRLPARVSLDRIGDYWMRGGYPAQWLEGKEQSNPSWAQDTLQTFMDRDLPSLSPGLGREKFRLFLQMLAQLSGSIVNYAEVARTLGVTQPTARAHFRIVEKSLLWRHLPAYEKNATKRVVKHPQGHLCDSGLLHGLLHLQDRDQLMAHPRMGQSWRGMVIENLLRGLTAADIDYRAYHYRTGAGATIDLVLEGGFGLLPVEIRHSRHAGVRTLRALRDFVAERGCHYGIVINNDEVPRLLEENLISLPFAAL